LEGSNGVVAANEAYKYDPYGADLADNTQAPGTTPAPPPPSATSLDQAALDNPFRFQGFYYDAAIKSYDMQAREYQPLVGRFTTPDRLEFAPADYSLQADPLTQDRYTFAAANPVNNTEWDGHCGPPPSSSAGRPPVPASEDDPADDAPGPRYPSWATPASAPFDPPARMCQNSRSAVHGERRLTQPWEGHT
jgi:RHS repeat-associated protein